MRRLKIAGLALMGILALTALTAATASAITLPDLHVLPGETYPAIAEGTIGNNLTTISLLETAVGSKLISKRVKLKLELKELSSLGPLSADFESTEEPKGKLPCNTEGDAEGIVLLPTGTEWHMVTTSEKPLTVQVLILVPDFEIKCLNAKKEAQLKVKISKKHLVLKLDSALNKDLSVIEVLAKCNGKGVQELTEWLNDAGELQKTQLFADFGLGAEKACFQAEETFKLTVQSKKLIEILG